MLTYAKAKALAVHVAKTRGEIHPPFQIKHIISTYLDIHIGGMKVYIEAYTLRSHAQLCCYARVPPVALDTARGTRITSSPAKNPQAVGVRHAVVPLVILTIPSGEIFKLQEKKIKLNKWKSLIVHPFNFVSFNFRLLVVNSL